MAAVFYYWLPRSLTLRSLGKKIIFLGIFFFSFSETDVGHFQEEVVRLFLKEKEYGPEAAKEDFFPERSEYQRAVGISFGFLLFLFRVSFISLS